MIRSKSLDVIVFASPVETSNGQAIDWISVASPSGVASRTGLSTRPVRGAVGGYAPRPKG